MNGRNSFIANLGAASSQGSYSSDHAGIAAPAPSLIGTLCNANGSAVRLTDMIGELSWKLGLSLPSGPTAETAKQEQTPSLIELATVLADRLACTEKLLQEIHSALGVR